MKSEVNLVTIKGFASAEKETRAAHTRHPTRVERLLQKAVNDHDMATSNSPPTGSEAQHTGSATDFNARTLRSMKLAGGTWLVEKRRAGAD